MGPRARRGRRSRRTPGRPPTTTPTTCWCGPSSASTGEVEIEIVCEPVFDYGRTAAEWTLVDDDRHTADATGAGQTVRLQTDMALGIEGDRVRARHVLRAGEQAYCALSWAEGLAAPADIDEADAAHGRHHARSGAPGWRERASLDHRYRQAIERSALTIKGLTYMPTGATVAALTTSLPETPGGERNWDYRYTWMRDSTFTLQALHYLDLDWEADEFMQFVGDLEPNDDGGLQIMYGIDGRRDLTETTRDDLVRLPRRPTGAGRQRGVRPAAERRVRRRARLDPAAHPAQRAPARGACGRSSSRRPRAPPTCGASPTRASGRPAASRSTTCRPSSCAGWRSTAPPSWPRSAATPTCRGDLAGDGRRDQGRHPRARRRRARRAAPALRHRRARRLDAAGGHLRLPPRRRRAPAGPRCSPSPTS